jgi:hypothetical protein
MFIPVFDSTQDKYYYWNPTSNSTQWELPKDLNLSTLAMDDPFYSSKDYYDWYQQQKPSVVSSTGEVAGSFNIKTGKFQSASTNEFYAADPKNQIISKAERHMNQYFDYSGYLDQRGAERQQELLKPKKKLTKKEIEQFKSRKQQKKREKLLKDYRKDMEYRL